MTLVCVCVFLSIKGTLLQGRLHVSRHRPRDKAEVMVVWGGREGEGEGEERRVIVPGAVCRNRAIHNDRVAVRLVPSSEMTDGECCELCERRELCDCVCSVCVCDCVCVCVCMPICVCVSAVSVEGGDDVLLGKVVGVLERDNREYVASFEVSE